MKRMSHNDMAETNNPTHTHDSDNVLDHSGPVEDQGVGEVAQEVVWCIWSEMSFMTLLLFIYCTCHHMQFGLYIGMMKFNVEA